MIHILFNVINNKDNYLYINICVLYYTEFTPHLSFIIFTDISNCATAPCVNGTWTDEINNFTCGDCSKGFGGKHCEVGKYSFFQKLFKHSPQSGMPNYKSKIHYPLQ